MIDLCSICRYLASVLMSVMIAAALASSAGASPPPMGADDARVARVAYRITTRNAERCDARTHATGIVFQHLAQFAPEDRPALSARFGLDRGPGIVAVIEGSPASRSGLRAGDVLLSIDGAPLPAASQADNGSTGARIAAIEGGIVRAIGGGARLDVLRGDAVVSIAITAVPACAASARLARSRQLNAFANHGYAIVTTRLLDSLSGDDELAVVLGHEIAHVLLGHDPEDRSSANERAADAYGLRLARDAGYDISAALPLWKRLAKARGPSLFGRHPSLSERRRMVRALLSEAGS